jgi:solute carrier family 50 protein (sugar transporter)
MISLDVVCNVAGVVGNVFSVALFLSPAPTFYQIIKRKSSMQDFMPHPYLATLLNCSLWLFYALPSVSPDTTLLATVNSIGLLIEAVYVGVFLVLAPSRERRLRTLAVLGGEAVFMAALVLGVLLGARTHEVRSTIVGNLCVVASSLMYASPLYVMRRVVKTKSVEYMLPSCRPWA